MIDLSITLVVGILIGSIFTTILVKLKYNKQLSKQTLDLKNSFTKEIQDKEISHQKQNEELITIRDESAHQKEITISKIGEAFHTGSQMMEEMSDGLSQIQGLVNNTSDPIQVIFEQGSQAQDMINNSRSSMANMSTSLSELTDISNLVTDLCNQMNQVNEKTQVIHNIANQANLLSLNASIEAARAGEAGRGFSVVANDMNRLSDMSASAAQDISKILSIGLKNIEKITLDMEDKVTTFTSVSSKVQSCFNNMSGAVQSISDLTESLNTSSQKTIEDVKNVSDTTQTTMESLTKMLSDITGIISGNIITDITATDANKNINDYTIIDVRNPNEFNDDLGHIERATLYCLQDNFKESISHLERDNKYLFVCRSGGRSARGARIAQALGFSDVSNLSGGMLKWRESFPQ